MKYINYQYANQDKETIDSATNYKDAKYLLNEYLLAYRGVNCKIWISQRKCN